MSAGKICSRVVAMVAPHESVRVAARRMAENEVGTLVVVDVNAVAQAAGIVTDRDIAIRCVAGNLDPDTTPVSLVMTSPVVSVDESTPIEEAASRMASAATRRIVVTAEGHRLVGILSVDDVLDLLIEEAKSVARLLEKQTPHIAA